MKLVYASVVGDGSVVLTASRSRHELTEKGFVERALDRDRLPGAGGEELRVGNGGGASAERTQRTSIRLQVDGVLQQEEAKSRDRERSIADATQERVGENSLEGLLDLGPEAPRQRQGGAHIGQYRARNAAWSSIA